MQTNLVASVFALVLTSALFALVPWGIAQTVTRNHPGLQDPGRRRTYRKATAVLFTVLAMGTAITPFAYFAALALAVYLHYHWTRVAHTPKGRAALRYQREERARELAKLR